MFSYDFKDNKDQEMYWDNNVQLLNKKKRIRNKLIFLLYIDTIIIFILANSLVAKMMIFIFNQIVFKTNSKAFLTATL